MWPSDTTIWKNDMLCLYICSFLPSILIPSQVTIFFSLNLFWEKKNHKNIFLTKSFLITPSAVFFYSCSNGLLVQWHKDSQQRITTDYKMLFFKKESICMTAWTDNIMHIDHLEVLLHIEKKINLLITIDVMKKTLFLCAKNQLDEPSPNHGTVAAVLSFIFIVYTFGCCYTRWSSSLKFSAKHVFLEGTVNFQNYFLLIKWKYWFSLWLNFHICKCWGYNSGLSRCE